MNGPEPANVGALARLGFNLPGDYGLMHIDPSLPRSNFVKSAGWQPSGAICSWMSTRSRPVAA